MLVRMQRDDQLEHLRKIYPGLSDEELREAKDNLDGYIDLSFRMYERIRNDPEAYAEFQQLIAKRQEPKPQ